MTPRSLTLSALAVAFLAVFWWTLKQGALPPADFSFSNETEIKSLDPAIVTGQPEGRIMWAIYEGLVRLGPKQETQPGVAKRWDVSDDGRIYTFHLRKDAKWSNGDPVTAADFLYSMRRVLDPITAAEYSYQAWYIENAELYTKPSRGLEVGKPVEVELHERPAGSLPFARGKVLQGELVAIELDEGADPEDEEKFFEARTFVVRIGGDDRRFRCVDEGDKREDAEPCKQVLLDFSEVGYKALDDYTIEMTLKARISYWPSLVGFYTLMPVHQATVEKHGAPHWTYAKNIVTNGPYRVAFRRLRDRVRLVKNEHYWDRDEVAIETIDAIAAESDITAYNLYATGQIDWVTKVEPTISNQLLKRAAERDDFNPAPQFTCYYYELNVEAPPLDDVRIRRALSLAMDRQEIVKTACAGEAPARSLVPPGLPGYTSPLCDEEDVDRAKALLEEAGYPEGRGFPTIEILYNSGAESHETIAELIRKQWQRNLGINVTMRKEEWSSYNNSLRQHKFQVARRAWGGDYLDPNTFLDMFVTGNENNDPNYSNPDYDDLIEQAKFEPDPETRLRLLYRAEKLLMSELPILPIYHYVSRNLVRPRVRGFYNNVQDIHPLWALSIDDDAPMPNEFMATAPRYQESSPAGEDEQ